MIYTKLGSELAKMFVIRYLNLSTEALEELKTVDSYDFNIFRLRELTNGNELETILPYVLAKNGLIGSNKLEFNNLMSFIREIAAGYKSNRKQLGQSSLRRDPRLVEKLVVISPALTQW